MKHTGQESGGDLCEIFKFWSFLQSKSVNSVCKLFQPRTGTWFQGPTGKVPHTSWAIDPSNEKQCLQTASPVSVGPAGEVCPQTTWTIAASNENSWRSHWLENGSNSTGLAGYSGAASHVLGAKMSLLPSTVKHTDRESGELCEIFNGLCSQNL